MSDSWSVNPSRVRGLGDIVSPKQLSSFDVWNTVLSSGSATIGDEVLTVYTGEYKVSCNFTDLSFLPCYSLEEDTATVSCKLKYQGTIVYGATVKCIVNDTVTYTGVTDNNGSVSFSIDLTLDDVLFYGVKLVFEGNSNVGGCFHNLHFWHGTVTGLSLVSDANIVGVDDDAHLLATLTGLNNQEVPVGVAGQTVMFYEEYTPGVRLSLPKVMQSGDEISITGELFDTVDGSRVCLAGETINVYEEYTPELVISANPQIIQSGDESTITVTARDTRDGSRLDNVDIKLYIEGVYPPSVTVEVIAREGRSRLKVTVTDVLGNVNNALVVIKDVNLEEVESGRTNNGVFINIGITPGHYVVMLPEYDESRVYAEITV